MKEEWCWIRAKPNLWWPPVPILADNPWIIISHWAYIRDQTPWILVDCEHETWEACWVHPEYCIQQAVGYFSTEICCCIWQWYPAFLSNENQICFGILLTCFYFYVDSTEHWWHWEGAENCIESYVKQEKLSFEVSYDNLWKCCAGTKLRY